MLVISRRKGQRIVIGNGLEIVVTGLSRSMVRLGIAAPIHTPVYRGEVWDSISDANRDAAKNAMDADLANLQEATTSVDRPTSRGTGDPVIPVAVALGDT